MSSNEALIRNWEKKDILALLSVLPPHLLLTPQELWRFTNAAGQMRDSTSLISLLFLINTEYPGVAISKQYYMTREFEAKDGSDQSNISPPMALSIWNILVWLAGIMPLGSVPHNSFIALSGQELRLAHSMSNFRCIRCSAEAHIDCNRLDISYYTLLAAPIPCFHPMFLELAPSMTWA